MDYIREIVSKKKKRLKTSKFNLDLSYITPRIIAMAKPGFGLESFYRNDITDVTFSKLLFTPKGSQLF